MLSHVSFNTQANTECRLNASGMRGHVQTKKESKKAVSRNLYHFLLLWATGKHAEQTKLWYTNSESNGLNNTAAKQNG